MGGVEGACPPVDEVGCARLAAMARTLVESGVTTVRPQDDPWGQGPFLTGRHLVLLGRAGVVSAADQRSRRRVLISDPDGAARAVTTWWMEQR